MQVLRFTSLSRFNFSHNKIPIRNMSAFQSRIVFQDPVPSDIEISQSIPPLPIEDIAESAGLLKSEIFPYGKNKCKVALEVRDRLASQEDGNYVVVTGINPTP